MIRKMLVGACLSAGATLAHSQNVQLYGVVDAAVEYITHVGPTGDRMIRMPSLSGGQLPSRWGLRGSEDLGDGLKAVFLLESGFAPDTGQLLQGGRLFGRQAYVGLSDDWGTVSFGRHWTMVFFSMLDADVIGPSSFGAAGLDSYLPQARVDNSASYRGTFNGFTVGATYSLGRDTLPPGNCAGEASGGCKAWSAMGKYDAASWGVAVAYDRQNGGPTGTFVGQPPGTVASSDNADKRLIVNGYLKVAGSKIGAGWIKRDLVARPVGISSDLFFVGVNYPVTGLFSVDAQYLSLRDDRPASNARMAVVRANYALSKRTWIYAMAATVSNDSNAAYSISAGGLSSSTPAVGRGQSGVLAGIRHTF